MKNYLLAYFRLHYFKSLSSRKLANNQKTMQIRMPFVQNNIYFCFLSNFLGKMASPQPVKYSISNLLYYLTQPTVQWLTDSTGYRALINGNVVQTNVLEKDFWRFTDYMLLLTYSSVIL